jgi:hypothetical protein
MRFFLLMLITFVLLMPITASATGNHYGWCNGVGNPHKGANCGGGSGPAGGQTPSTVPTSNQLPQPGNGPQPTPDQLPITVTPNPPTTVTGTSPVVNVQPIPTPSFTGQGQPPITVTPNPPTTFTGTSPVITVQPIPTPSFTGQGQPPINVMPNPPQTFTGVGPVPATIIVTPNTSQTFTGYGRVPQPLPQAVPQLIPSAIPTPNPRPQPTLIPRPKPINSKTTSVSNGIIKHKPVSSKPALGSQHVTQLSGRQPLHNAPRFAASDGGKSWHCIASGHGQRRTYTDGRVTVSGALRHIGAVDVLGRDLPALHPDHADCIISIRRRSK